MQGNAENFESADSVKSTGDDRESVNFPTEYLNTINASGLPPHKLPLKLGHP